MESTAQYWRPVWNTLERYWSAQCRGAEGADPMSGSLLLALAQSNRGPRVRKRDFVDAERLLKRLVAQELVLSFVPGAEQRVWRTVVRRKYQLTRDRVRLQNQLESLLEEAQVKLSSLVSDLFGLSARRMLRALAPQREHFLRRSIWLRGLECAQVNRKVLESRRATAHRRATASCAGCSISAPMLPSRSRAAFSRLSFGVCFHALVSSKQFGRSLTDYPG